LERILKILVVDDHALVREGLCQVLQGLDSDEPTLVLQASYCAQAFELATEHPDIDLVLLDYHLPDMDGMAALAVFGKQHPELPVVILSGSANPSIARRVMLNGAAGFITKSGRSDELLGALHHVLAGGIYESQEFGGTAPTSELQPINQPPVFTPRQEEVLSLLLAGYSNREISEQLSLSDETVKNHVSSILRGFGVKTRMQAALEAARWGYVKVPGGVL
jgi:DNA-binding NarL/FixJ family response regulator